MEMEREARGRREGGIKKETEVGRRQEGGEGEGEGKQRNLLYLPVGFFLPYFFIRWSQYLLFPRHCAKHINKDLENSLTPQ